VKSIFKATAILSGSSIASILLSLVSAKVMALYLQPSGYGYYGLLQSFVALSSLVTGLGIATGMVRMGAGAATGGDQLVMASLRRAAWVLFAGLTGIATVVLVIFRHTISQWAVGTPDHAGTIVWMAIALVFTVAGAIQAGMLNAYHRVGALAKYGVVNTVMNAAVSIPAILIWHMQGIVPAVIGGGVVSWLASGYFLRREVGPLTLQPSRHEVLKSVRSLLRFGGPYTASMLIGTGVQLALPMVVVHLLSTESVGYYRSAAAISVGYLGFLVTAMGQDYYPRLSAVGNEPGALVKLINEQHRLVMILAVPMILVTLALVPVFIPIVYSHKFYPAIDILEWQLIGDIFKFSSWTMSFAILARCGSLTYFVTECIGGVVTLASTWLAVRWYGLPGLGISFLITYIVYYLVVWIVIRREIPLVWTSANKRMMLAAVAAALVVRILPATKFASLRTPVSLSLAVIAGIPSLWMVWREFRTTQSAIATDNVSPGAKQSPATV
jgi:PST family polysaccharide transporter